MKRAISIILAAVMLLAVLPLTAQATTITRIDEFRFVANPNAIALTDTKTVGDWLNNLKNADNGIGKGVMAAADAEGWEVDDIWGVYDYEEGRLLKSDEYADLTHTNWLRVEVKLTDPENYAFNGDKDHTFTTYVNGLQQGGAPLDIYGCIDIHLYSFARIHTAEFTVPKPQPGDKCSNYVPKVGDMPFNQGDHIKILSYSWCIFDPYTHWGEECTEFSDSTADYGLIIEFTTDKGYFFGSTGTVKVNGKEVEFSQHGDSEGNTITKCTYDVSFEDFSAYDLWLGSIRVTDNNKDDIFRDGGKAKFDPDTNTLTLNDPTITDVYEDYCVICSDLDDLTVKGKATINRPDVTETIYANSLTLSGDFNFTSDETSVFINEGDLTIEDSTLKLCSASGGDAIDCESGSLTVKNSTVTTVDSYIYVSGDVMTENSTLNVDCYFGNYGIYANGGINLVNSEITVTGSMKYGVFASGGVIIISGTNLDAYGTEAAIANQNSMAITNYSTVYARGGKYGIMCTGKLKINSTTSYVEAWGTESAIMGYKGLTVGDGLTITEPAGGKVNSEETDIVTATGDNATHAVIERSAASGSTVSGTVTSYLDETGVVVVQLLQGDVEKYYANIFGNTVGYSIEGVADGSYTMRVSKNNHVSRDYDIIVSGDTVMDAKICPVGDVNMSGTVTTMDVTMTNSHVQKKSTLEGYQLKLADANKSNTVTTMDVTMINSHVQKKSSLWK